MKLLVFTQKVNLHDSDLGFFHAWLIEMSKQVDSLLVVCLEKGEYHLPENTTVFSLGKEDGVSRLAYLINFYRFIFRSRKNYDTVFVHMNPEYVILGGLFWRIWNKKILLWYTHKSVNLRLRLAELFATKIFTASKESFRLPSKKIEIVGHGIDVDAILPKKIDSKIGDYVRLLWVGRISAVKDLETAILAVKRICDKGMSVQFSIVGTTITSEDVAYKQTLIQLIHEVRLEKVVHWLGAMPPEKLFGEYSHHDIFIHTSKTGSIDKVVLEALAAGLCVITSSNVYGSFGDLVEHFPANDSEKLAECIEKNVEIGIMKPSISERREFVKTNHNLRTLIGKIFKGASEE
jgi:glycosyltransferase involved in cell wall biosynthesis